MLEPTLVNSATLFPRILESKSHLEMGKSRGKCEGERQRGALVDSLLRRLVCTELEQQRLENVRWRRAYIDRRAPPIVTYPAVRSNKIETEI